NTSLVSMECPSKRRRIYRPWLNDSLGSGSRANRRVAAVVDEMFHWTPALLLGLVGDLIHPAMDMHIINRSPASPQIGFVLYSPKAATVTKLPRASEGEEELTDEHCCIIRLAR
ncbi:hypothetical protein FOZ61_009068, partial [Perkinsus olseni]